ncbi:ABC transporter ATP-binding protein [Nonomuraea rubra]|uniref:Peptide/nickel transport system ATP-binding protein n=1 Tax=Nonomuraea rubra TaxID=46180 RepID=A0A7X0U2V7_9ACTN|nr:ATP-binding cassette domain-containing protein [Nonomuraea rubra]MBB6553247.1 peptide/nickel transport system ATP-binding protein [Nonomuraea rubra]
MNDHALRVTSLSVRYPNGFEALRDLSFTVPADTAAGIVGASGSGKSTLIRAILGLLPAGSEVSGKITVGGHDVLHADEATMRGWRGRLIGYVGQDPFAACDPLRSVRHHIEQAWHVHRLRPPADAVVDGLSSLAVADPAARAGQRPHQWSGGMLQRATTVAATAHRPLITLADEPTSALDAELADGSLTLLRKSCGALLLISHDLASVARHTDHVVVLDRGRVVEDGEAHVLLSSPRSPVTRSLLEASDPQPLHRPPVGTPVVVELRSVSKAYEVAGHRTPVIVDADLTIRRGEIVGVVGPSGSGKSTLLRLLSGQERPDSGDVLAEGEPLCRSGLPRPGWIMPVFQDPVTSLDPRWPLWRTITEPLVLRGERLSRGQRRQRARAALDGVGLAHLDILRRPGSLSVGECQRVAIVRAVIAGPGVIVADEPTASLDAESAATIAALLRRLADEGAAVLVVSHDERRLRSYADRVLRMHQGQATP